MFQYVANSYDICKYDLGGQNFHSEAINNVVVLLGIVKAICISIYNVKIHVYAKKKQPCSRENLEDIGMR